MSTHEKHVRNAYLVNIVLSSIYASLKYCTTSKAIYSVVSVMV